MTTPTQIAEVLRDLAQADYGLSLGNVLDRRTIANRFADMLEKEDGHFNRKAFIKACLLPEDKPTL